MLCAVIGDYRKWSVKIAVTIDERSVNMRTVRVEWEGPLSLDAVKALDGDDEDCGLYQILCEVEGIED